MTKPESLYIVFDTSPTNDMTVLGEREKEVEGGSSQFYFLMAVLIFVWAATTRQMHFSSKVQLGALTWNLPPVLQWALRNFRFSFFFLIFSNLLNSFSWNMFFEFVTDRFFLSAVLDLLTTYVYLFSRLAYISLSKWKITITIGLTKLGSNKTNRRWASSGRYLPKQTSRITCRWWALSGPKTSIINVCVWFFLLFLFFANIISVCVWTTD